MSSRIREKLTPAQRATPLEPYIDPGFVHHRKIETILGPSGMRIIDDLIRQLPELPEWQRPVRIDHVYTEIMLAFCNKLSVPPLEEFLVSRQGRMFCSTEELAPCKDVFKTERAVSIWVPPGIYDRRVEFHYSTEHIRSHTLRNELHKGSKLSIIAELHNEDDKVIVFHPIIIGFPWLRRGDSTPDFEIIPWGPEFFENFVEDFDEFKKVLEIPEPPDPEPMRHISERAFKECLRRILGDTATKDWGGETSDYYTAHLHLKGQRVTAAFLLKGPADFVPMDLRHLGKKHDQILRLARESAQVLVVQHCHDILSPVRETLRTFAVQPSRARRYCLIDGRDSLRLLQAYDLYDWAVQKSRDA